MELRVTDRPARVAAGRIAELLRDAVRARGSATLAVSGGSTAPPMLAELAGVELDWSAVTVWQVDERIVPDGHPARNARQLEGFPARVRPMPVTSVDLRRAARRYAASLPARFDVVHLGLGDDGHTASWPPDQPEVLHSHRAVELTAPFGGHRRMTITPSVVDVARDRVVLTTGAAKQPMVRRFVEGDPSIPVDRVPRDDTLLVVDAEAAP